jgi:hypothetical protein
MSKVTFDGPQKLIVVNSGVTSIDVAIDMYSAWKQWVLIDPNSTWDAAFRVVGGDAIGANQFIPSYFFLINTWRVKVENENVNFATNLYSDDYLNPFIIVNAAVYNKNSDVPGAETLTGLTAEIASINSQLSAITSDVSALYTTLNDVAINVLTILGLSQHNYRLVNHAYDAENKLLSCNIRIYSSAVDADQDVNPFGIYRMDAVYDGAGNLVDYKVVEV